MSPPERQPPQERSRLIRRRIPRPNRPMAPVWWYGGKGVMARRLMPLLPDGRVYVEPFCGAASLFWHLDPPRPAEVLNDLDEAIVELFRVLQDPAQFEELAHRLTWTLYSLSEFRRALKMRRQPELSAVDRAWAFFTRQNQGFNGRAVRDGDWSRVFVSSRGMIKTATVWRGRLALLDWWHERLSRVQLECRDALDVIRYWDSPETVFYCDPPYAGDTRAKGARAVYAHEATDAQLAALVDALLGIRGQAMLSGYAHPLFAPLEAAGWERREFYTACYTVSHARGSRCRGIGAALRAVPRTEVVWIRRFAIRGTLL